MLNTKKVTDCSFKIEKNFILICNNISQYYCFTLKKNSFKNKLLNGIVSKYEQVS